MYGRLEVTQAAGKFAGPHYRKQPRPASNSSVVAAKRDAEGSANVSRQPCSALPFASVVDVFITNMIV